MVFLWERGDAVLVDVVSEEIQVVYTEETLVGVDDHAMRGESFKHSS